MSVYNDDEVVSGAIESILSQTYSDFELILIDDGSEDQTEDVLKSYSDERIRVFVNETNRGLARSLNKGLTKARGDLIARMDADDRSMPNRFAKQVEVLDSKENPKVVGCWYRIVDQNGEPLVDVTDIHERTFSVDDLIQNGPGLMHGSVMCCTEALREVGGYRERFLYAQDFDLWLRLAGQFGSECFHVVREILCEYTIRREQFNKRPIQRAYEDYARNCARHRKLDEREPDPPSVSPARQSITDRDREALYHRTVGVTLLHHGRPSCGRQALLKSLQTQPTRRATWLYLLLSFIPGALRSPMKGYGKWFLRRLNPLDR